VQCVLSVKNSNFLRALLLDGLTVSVYEAATGPKLTLTLTLTLTR
tara:strand:+ start:40 stop:174 length:135 start_codon:yes stop_codon:yes gene_type:complete